MARKLARSGRDGQTGSGRHDPMSSDHGSRCGRPLRVPESATKHGSCSRPHQDLATLTHSPHPHMPLLQVVTVSTRQGRVGTVVANWFLERARAHGAFTVEGVDLAEVNLPMFDEPKHPRFG